MIDVRNLRKEFGPKVAVNGISFLVEKGEVLGFLGPDGAGKSTMMRMITGFIPPTEGEVKVGGFDMLEQPLQAKRLIGYLPENAPSYTDMTVLGFLNFSAELRGLFGLADGHYPVRITVGADFPKSRPPQQEETPEDNTLRDQEFAENLPLFVSPDEFLQKPSPTPSPAPVEAVPTPN